MRERFDKFDANMGDEALVGDEYFLAHAEVLVADLFRIILLLPHPEQMIDRITQMVTSHLNNREQRVGKELPYVCQQLPQRTVRFGGRAAVDEAVRHHLRHLRG